MMTSVDCKNELRLCVYLKSNRIAVPLPIVHCSLLLLYLNERRKNKFLIIIILEPVPPCCGCCVVKTGL